jgi:2-polyprenyl-3-methyl-5-hydroxy-6-metoxy-1,4-benzoquinol methylase
MQTRFYDEYIEVEDTHWWFRGRRRILPTLLRPHLRPPVRILDIGPGGGFVSQALLEFGPVTACDVDDRCAAAVERRGGIPFIFGRAEAVPFPDASFDLVTAFDVLEHVENDAGVVREMVRLVEPGGAVAVAVPAYEWMWGRQDEISGHLRRYSRRVLRRRLEAAGLRVERLTYFNTILLPVAAAVRLFRRRSDGTGPAQEPHDLESDLSMTPPGPLNELLTAIFSLERFPLRHMNLPVGVSLFAFARRRR